MDSLHETYKKDFENKEYEYILVDNFSEDDSVKILSSEIKKYSGFHLFENPSNNGFGAGNNYGAKHAKGEYILFLNNDTQIKGNGISKMVEYLNSHPNVGIVGGELKNLDGSSQSSVGTFFTLFPTILLLLGMQRLGVTDQNPKKVQEVDWVKGALLMIRKELFEKVDGFDEKIFMYTEDMELCYRVKKLGFPIVFIPTDGILHHDQGSSNRTFAILNIYKNIPYFYKKHMPKWQLSVVKKLLISKATILVIVGKIINNTYLTSTYEQAIKILR